MKLRPSRRSTMLGLLVLPVVGACLGEGDDAEAADDDGTPLGGDDDDTGGGTTPAAGGSTGGAADPMAKPSTSTAGEIYGDWSYTTAFYPKNGGVGTTTIGGELYLRRDRTWSHNRRIGGVVATGKGTFTVQGTKLTLKHDDKSSDLVYTFILGTHTTGAETFRALTLELGDGWSYLLVAAKG